MGPQIRNASYAAIAFGLALATPAEAALVVSKSPTSNVACAGGVCIATAADAVLNVRDLKGLLQSADVTLVSGSAAQDIAVSTELAWTSASHLTLDAWRGIAVTKPVTSQGTGGVTLVTNDGGTDGDYVFQGQGRIAFWDLGSALTINGIAYTLVGDIAGLADAVHSNAKGSFALANNYDAAPDGTYPEAPVVELFRGTFEGLGHSIANLTIETTRKKNAGLFAHLSETSMVRDLRLAGVSIHATHSAAGALVGLGTGTILRVSASGAIVFDALKQCEAGGLAGVSWGTLSLSSADVAISNVQPRCMLGGLVGENIGLVDRSFATGAVSNGTFNGGVAGDSNSGSIRQSYATGAVTGGHNESFAGGLVGITGVREPDMWGSTVESYSTGHVTGDKFADDEDTGGLIGFDSAPAGFVSRSYWDRDTSGISDPSQGAGFPQNDPGITGLTTAAFKAALPAGFDPAVWGQSAGINGGYPYLLANPPQ